MTFKTVLALLNTQNARDFGNDITEILDNFIFPKLGSLSLKEDIHIDFLNKTNLYTASYLFGAMNQHEM